MFAGCTSLIEAPALPATALAFYCYYNMFAGCTSLTTAPALPATVLADFCYYNMFAECTSLTTAPAELPAAILATYCYDNMFLRTNITEYYMPNLTVDTVTANISNWGIGVGPDYQPIMAVVYCKNGVVVVNDTGGSSN